MWWDHTPAWVQQNQRGCAPASPEWDNPLCCKTHPLSDSIQSSCVDTGAVHAFQSLVEPNYVWFHPSHSYFRLHSLSQSLPDGEGDSEQHLWTLKENRVPDFQHGGRRQAGGEHGEEPLHSEHVGQRGLVAAWGKSDVCYLWNSGSAYAVEVLLLWTCARLYLQLLCWQLSEGGGDAGRVWAASGAAGLWTLPCPLTHRHSTGYTGASPQSVGAAVCDVISFSFYQDCVQFHRNLGVYSVFLCLPDSARRLLAK